MYTHQVCYIFVFCGMMFANAQIDGEIFENAILVSQVMTNPLGRKVHINMIAGTLYDTIDEMSYSTFSLTDFSARIKSMEIDYARRRLYIYDNYVAAIYVIDNFDWRLNFTNLRLDLFHNGVSRSSVRLGLDWLSGNVYWTDAYYNWIAVQSPSKADVFKILIHANLQRPEALAVDPVNRYLFWSDTGSTSVKIERSTLSGQDRQTIVSTGLAYPRNIDIDQRANKIVWIDSDRDTIETANFDGSERRAIRRISHSTFFDVAVFRDLVCLSDTSNSSITILNKNTGAVYSNIQSPSEDPWVALAIYSADVQPISSDVCTTSGCSDLCFAGTSGPVCMCREGFKLNTDGHTCSEDTGVFHRALIWTNRTNICLTDIRILATTTQLTECVYTIGKNITHFDLDMSGREVVFADGFNIFILHLRGNNVERLITTSSHVTGLAIDWRDKNVYWSEGGSNGRINLVARQTGDEFNLVDTNLIEPRSLLLQPLNEYMFWISGPRGSYRFDRSQLDGSNRIVIVQPAALTNPSSLTTDVQTNRLYFVDSGFVKSCDPDGKDLKVFTANTPFFDPRMVLVYKNILVVSDSGLQSTLKLFDKAGTTLHFSNTEFDVDNINDMKVLDESLQLQQQGPCDVYNGGCEHICIPVGRNRICQCEYGFQIDSNKETCSSDALFDDFLLVSDWTHNKMYQVSLSNGAVKAVDTKTFGSPIGVAYNNATQDVIWSTELRIHQFNFRSKEYKTLFNTEPFMIDADRFAIDFTGGNIFYTAVPRLLGLGTIAVLSPDGLHKIIIKDGARPRAIALDPEQGILFWTDHSQSPSFVKRANMDGTSIQTLVTSNTVWPNGLAIDTKAKYLYLSDGAQNTIRRCTYSGACSTYYTDPEAHLMDIKLLGNYLYYTAWNRVYITKLHKNDTSDISRVAQNAELGRLDALSLYSSSLSSPTVSAYCKPNNGRGPCSTFCLPKSGGYSCACEDGVRLLSDRSTCENVFTTTTTQSTSTTSTTTSSSSTTTTLTPTKTTLTTKAARNELNGGGIYAAAIGGGAAGFVVLLIFIVVLVLILVRRTRGREHDHETNCEENKGFDMSSIYRDRPSLPTPLEPQRDTTYDMVQTDLIDFDLPQQLTGDYEKLHRDGHKGSSSQDTTNTGTPSAVPNDYLSYPVSRESNDYMTPMENRH